VIAARARTFLLAGGGTGGHLYPGLALAEAISARLASEPPAKFIYLCSDRAVDRAILTEAGVEMLATPARPVGLKPLALWRFARSWGPSVRLGRSLIARERAAGREVAMIATGGFVSAPMAQAARAERVPLTLLNLDAVPGRANRWIARFADRVFTSLPVAPQHARRVAKWTTVAPVVRASARLSMSQADARRALGLELDRPVLLVTGASLGAKSVNDFLAAFAASAPGLRGWQVLHQTGQGDWSALRAAYAAAGVAARVEPFVTGLGVWWRAADLAVSRAGAGSVAEAWGNGVPTIFLPYPYHRDEHQRHNTRVLVEAGAALVEKDHIAAPANLAHAGTVLAGLLASPDRRAALARALAGLGPVDGADRIAAALIGS